MIVASGMVVWVTGQQAREQVERERRKEAHRVGETQSSLSQSTNRIGE